jgi:putative glycosyltransferase
MKLSIVTTLYRSAPTIREFYRRALTAAEAITEDIELVIVNDGSPDNSLELAIDLHRSDCRVVVVDLSRNFGHHKAMMTGLAHASGDVVFLIDSDLEEEPELLSRFHERFAQGDCDVVFGAQKTRRGGWFERVTGSLFFFLVNALSDQPLPRNLATVRLMSRDYVRSLVRHRDREFVIAQLWAMTGFRQCSLSFEKLSLSPTTYSRRLRFEMAIKYLTVTSTKLLHLILYAGTIIFCLSVFVILYYLARYFAHGVGPSGYTSLIISIWFFGGSTTLILGVIGLYIANILSETKRRPYTVVRHLHRRSQIGGPNAIRVTAREQGPGRAKAPAVSSGPPNLS